MKKFILISYSFLFLFVSQESFAYPSIVSANGFFCSRSQSLVTCQGQLPNIPGIFTTSGMHFVQFTYETLGFPKMRYFYDSITGCLMQITLGPRGEPTEAFVKNARGKAAKFFFPSQQSQAS